MDSLAQPRTRWVAAVGALELVAAAIVGFATPASAVAITISGQVQLPSGAPVEYLSDVTVKVDQVDGVGAGEVAVSPVDGTYTIPDLPPGTYSVQFIAESDELVSEYYDDSYTEGGQDIVDATAGNATGIDATLGWAGTISGTVTLGAGLPDHAMEGVRVLALGAGGFAVADIDVTSGGAFTIARLPAGDYKVFFDKGLYFGPDGVTTPGYVREYYNNVYDSTSAQVVSVASHADVIGINATLDTVGHFTSTPAPTINVLSPVVGATLGLSTGGWRPSPDSWTIQWRRGGVAIPGATGLQYKVVTADLGRTITVTVTAKKTAFTTAAKTSAGLKILKSFTNRPTPTISGTGRVGHTLTAVRGTWTPSPTVTSYQWKRGGVSIAGATKSTYKLTSSDRGKKITVTVTAKRSGYAPASKTSAAKTIAW